LPHTEDTAFQEENKEYKHEICKPFGSMPQNSHLPFHFCLCTIWDSFSSAFPPVSLWCLIDWNLWGKRDSRRCARLLSLVLKTRLSARFLCPIAPRRRSLARTLPHPVPYSATVPAANTNDAPSAPGGSGPRHLRLDSRRRVGYFELKSPSWGHRAPPRDTKSPRRARRLEFRWFQNPQAAPATHGPAKVRRSGGVGLSCPPAFRLGRAHGDAPREPKRSWFPGRNWKLCPNISIGGRKSTPGACRTSQSVKGRSGNPSFPGGITASNPPARLARPCWRQEIDTY